MKKFKYSEITPENIYKNRRKFIKNMGLAAGSMFIGHASTQALQDVQAHNSSLVM